MIKKIYLPLMLLMTLAFVGCNKDMKPLSADYFTVTPSPLEVVGGQVPATVTGTFPEKYFDKKSVVTGVEMFRKILDEGEAGDNVGLLLRGIDKNEIKWVALFQCRLISNTFLLCGNRNCNWHLRYKEAKKRMTFLV